MRLLKISWLLAGLLLTCLPLVAEGKTVVGSLEEIKIPQQSISMDGFSARRGNALQVTPDTDFGAEEGLPQPTGLGSLSWGQRVRATFHEDDGLFVVDELAILP